jgi:hypothetical protein
MPQMRLNKNRAVLERLRGRRRLAQVLRQSPRNMRPMRRTGAVWDELIRNFYRQDAKSAMV